MIFSKKFAIRVEQSILQLAMIFFFNKWQVLEHFDSQKKHGKKYSNNNSDNAHMAIFHNWHGKNLFSEIDMKKIEWKMKKNYKQKIAMAYSY